MAAIKRRDLADLPACQIDGHGDGLPGMAAAGRPGQALVLNLVERRLKQTTAQATSTNANHRSEPLSGLPEVLHVTVGQPW
jgi:hypothetical protein